MIDTHYDLLTICYVCYLNNDYTKIEKIANEIRNNEGNIKCIFANLYFMSEQEMKDELGENYYNPYFSILPMFRMAKKILEEYLPDINFIYSIEGCDYINIDELDLLYEEGLRSITLVWNNKNKYGCGVRATGGLTKEGISFINRAIELGIGIDLSHANERTFFDIISLIDYNQKQAKKVFCYASHSNARKLCERDRNLTDKQLIALKQVGGLVGVFSNTNFVVNDYDLSNPVKRRAYVDQVKYIADMIGVDNVMISTDDMRYCGIPGQFGEPIYDYNKIYSELKEDLLTRFRESDVDKILYKNIEKIINKLIHQEKNKTL